MRGNVLQGANAARHAMEAQLKEAQRAMGQTKQHHAREMAQLQQSLKHEADRGSQLEIQTKEFEDAKFSKRAAQHAADSFSQQLKKLQQELLQAQQASRQAELISFNKQTDLERSEAACSKLEATKAALQASHEHTIKKHQECQAEVVAQRKLLQEAATRDDAAQARANKLEVALLAAQGSHAASSAATQKLDESSSADRASLQAEYTQLQSSYDANLARLEAANARLSQQDLRCSDLQQALEAKQASLSTTSTALDAKEKEAQVLVAAIDKLEAEVQTQRKMQAQQDDRFAAASACLVDLREDFQCLQISAEADNCGHAATADGQQARPHQALQVTNSY